MSYRGLLAAFVVAMALPTGSSGVASAREREESPAISAGDTVDSLLGRGVDVAPASDLVVGEVELAATVVREVLESQGRARAYLCKLASSYVSTLAKIVADDSIRRRRLCEFPPVQLPLESAERWVLGPEYLAEGWLDDRALNLAVECRPSSRRRVLRVASSLLIGWHRSQIEDCRISGRVGRLVICPILKMPPLVPASAHIESPSSSAEASRLSGSWHRVVRRCLTRIVQGGTASRGRDRMRRAIRMAVPGDLPVEMVTDALDRWIYRRVSKSLFANDVDVESDLRFADIQHRGLLALVGAAASSKCLDELIHRCPWLSDEVFSLFCLEAFVERASLFGLYASTFRGSKSTPAELRDPISGSICHASRDSGGRWSLAVPHCNGVRVHAYWLRWSKDLTSIDLQSPWRTPAR